ncbi:iron-sulfur cluster carrier protein ApbC [Vibrio salinus]|uniref:iron-sulfur cluster carrier protein ApbC n=1 Tax=Vibrio salinus TaxID=2899784 RepID=UPI001E38CBB3|nr:iron-sulfur cluster carrier protein ApbC [Vibrio salinus]MCE0492954.1 iron-sulfur cluster carrier protein ApbC [Vibrio salinus]
MRQFETKDDFIIWLDEFSHSSLISGWPSTPGVVSYEESTLKITIPFAANSLVQELQIWIENQKKEAGFELEYRIKCQPGKMETHLNQYVKGVRNIIAVSSAKGGVGKSTTAVNLALALAQSHSKVGLLDADIYGPSVPIMLGLQDASPDIVEQKWMKPVEAYGLFTNSIGYLVSSDDAAIWRGPMASKALQQLLNETLWPDLDYLVIDMPPGTGDIQLTLAQEIPVTSAVVVTTPQDLALADAQKGVAMFEKVDVPVAGLIENMSYHICSHCGHREAIFGTEGVEDLAQKHHLPVLAQLPLHISIREDIDAGCPTVIRHPDSPYTSLYVELAERLASQLFWQGNVKPDDIPVMTI